MKFFVQSIIILFLISCASVGKTNLKPAVNVRSKPQSESIFKKAAYTFATKEGQDRADIKLALYDDHTFKFWLMIFSPEEQSQDYSEFSGKWKLNGEMIEIHFTGKKPILSALIETENESVKLLSDSAFSFSANSQELTIWGLLLDRI